VVRTSAAFSSATLFPVQATLTCGSGSSREMHSHPNSPLVIQDALGRDQSRPDLGDAPAVTLGRFAIKE
jgi:hypothetical protein